MFESWLWWWWSAAVRVECRCHSQLKRELWKGCVCACRGGGGGVIDKQPSTLHCGLSESCFKEGKSDKRSVAAIGVLRHGNISVVDLCNISKYKQLYQHLLKTHAIVWLFSGLQLKHTAKKSWNRQTNYLSNHHPKIKMHSTLVYIKASQQMQYHHRNPHCQAKWAFR